MNVKELFSLKNSVAIITGGSSGLGHQMATGLAEVGSNLVIASRRYELCKSVCEDFKKRYGVDALAIKTDVTIEKDIKNMVKETIRYFKKIDILVNNVGSAIISDTVSTTLENWNYILNSNITSMFLCCREVGKYMIERRYGKIINISSVYGLIGTDSRNYVKGNKKRESLSYCTTKGAIINFTKDLAVNLAKYNITVNAISPGGFLTETTEKMVDSYVKKKFCYKIPMKRFGDSDDLKGAIVLLASNASKYITGQNLIVDGGWTSW